MHSGKAEEKVDTFQWKKASCSPIHPAVYLQAPGMGGLANLRPLRVMVSSLAASFVPPLDLLLNLKILVLRPSKPEERHSGRVPHNSDVPPCAKTCGCLSIPM